MLDYCLSGNLQSVLDEYAHVLVESLGLNGKPNEAMIKGIVTAMVAVISLRTSTAKADLIEAGRRRVTLDDQFCFRTRFAMRFGDQEHGDGGAPTRADNVRAAFNSPFSPFVMTSTSVGQEGLVFHSYCHAIIHWNLPSNPVDLEQREGRIHRYKGHAVRKNIAHTHHSQSRNGYAGPWNAMFAAARKARAPNQSVLYPFGSLPMDQPELNNMSQSSRIVVRLDSNLPCEEP